MSETVEMIEILHLQAEKFQFIWNVRNRKVPNKLKLFNLRAQYLNHFNSFGHALPTDGFVKSSSF